MSLFPIPVSGQPIPRGWFARLVRFMNSLILRGDETYLSVKHTAEGTLIRPTNYLIEQLTKSGGTPGGMGAPQHLTVDVTGGAATVGLSGSTATAQFVGTGNVNVSGNTNGQIEIGVSGGTAGAGYPVWRNFTPHSLSEHWTSNNQIMSPITLDYSGYLRITYTYHSYIHNDNPTFSEDVAVYVDGKLVWRKYPFHQIEPYSSGDTVPVVLTVSDYFVDLIPVCAGSIVTASCGNLDDSIPSLYLDLLQDTTI